VPELLSRQTKTQDEPGDHLDILAALRSAPIAAQRSSDQSTGGVVAVESPTRWYLGVIKNPPSWARYAGVLVPFVVGSTIAQRRDTVAGVVCALCMLCAVLPATISMERTRAWGARHPVLDSSASLLFFFVGFAYFAPRRSLIWCLAGAAVAALVLTVLSALRRRGAAARAASQSDDSAGGPSA
jgi:hypothetical protein